MAVSMTNEEGNNCFHELLRSADCEDEIEIEEKLIEFVDKSTKECIISLINQRNVCGNTPLMEHMLCEEPSLKLVSHTIKFGCDVNIANNLGMTPIHILVSKQCIPKRLLDDEYLGVAERNIVNERNQNEKAVMKAIIDVGGNVNQQDLFGRSPLFLANDLEVIHMLIQSGADVNMTDKWGRTLLHSVLSMPNYKHLARFYLKKLNSKLLWQADIFGSTPLHYCAILSREDMFHELKGHMPCISLEDSQRNKAIDILQRRMSYREHRDDTKEGVDVLHYKDVINKKDALAGIKQITESLIKSVLNQPGYGEPWDEKESTLIVKTIVDFAQYMCRRIGEMDERLKCSLFRTGSSAEETKISDPTEFDFVFCLTNFADLCRIVEVEDKRGFAEVQADDIPENYESFFCCNKKCNVPEIRFAFSKILKRLLSDDNTWKSPNLYFDGNVHHLEEYDRPVLTLKLRWFGCLYKDEEISLDIVPAIQKKGWWPSDTEFGNLTLMTQEIKDEGCLLLLQNPYLQSDTLLRISCSPAEICLIKSLPLYIKESYRLCKLLKHKSICPRLDPDSESDVFPKFEAEDSITSYMLKNSLFHILSTDSITLKTKHTPDFNKSVINLAGKLLTFLDHSTMHETLPVYFIPNRQDIFMFDFSEIDNLDEPSVKGLNNFHCLRRHAFLKIMLHILGLKKQDTAADNVKGEFM
ncbi:uncharacterized protein LOC117116471 [Anneissia japonica]|uniref:uncharacterized protein LOC117116471 n=1 Tax=Anneissia japonica TaxID=1529436 RepID=UPI001425BB0C|nr:uncharacterized protein LOC117116471 [Anneissia japonica]